MRLLFLLLLPVLAVAGQLPRFTPLTPLDPVPVKGGDEILAVDAVSAPRPQVSNALDELWTVGTTWYDYQHNGTAGKMIQVDENGFVHCVWMNGLDEASAGRHVFYNAWDPAQQIFIIGGGIGLQVNASQRAGYTCQALSSDGFCFPTFHNKTAVNQIFGHATVGYDVLPVSGAFATSEPARLVEGDAELELDWPKSALDRNGMIHMVSTENPLGGEAGTPQRIYYSRGVPQYDNSGFGIGVQWQPVSGNDHYLLIDTVMVIAANIACSRHTDRVAMVWSHSQDTLTAEPSQYNNDLYLMISEDGGLNWGPQINVTDFEQPDYDCASGDTVECDRDTFRVYTDVSILFDEDDQIHLAFTTGYLYSLEGTINIVFSDVWHWDETGEYFSNIAHGFFDTATALWVDPGAWQRVVQRPSLAIDTVANNLYCSFQRYDTLQASEVGWPQGEAYVAMSTDGGTWWSEAVNVTNTNGGSAAPAGESLSERDITVADLITYEDGTGYLHMQYVLDLDAGGIAQTEGVATENPVVYSRIDINDIPALPLHDARYPVLRVDSTGFPPPFVDAAHLAPSAVPDAFALHQNYPNPFNPATTIRFDLGVASTVTLRIFDVTGRVVKSLVDRKPMSAGVHGAAFDAAGFASGIYFYRLEIGESSITKKMVLLK